MREGTFGGWTIREITTTRCRIFGHHWGKKHDDGWRDCRRDGCSARVQFAKDDPDRA